MTTWKCNTGSGGIKDCSVYVCLVVRVLVTAGRRIRINTVMGSDPEGSPWTPTVERKRHLGQSIISQELSVRATS